MDWLTNCKIFFLTLLFCSTGKALPMDLVTKIHDAASRAFLDPKLVEAVVSVESSFKAYATSPKGAMGLMQVMPQTAVDCHIHDPYHSLDNLMGACHCLRLLLNRYQGNLRLALAAYNSGPHNVDKFKGIPPFRETKMYVQKVLYLYQQLKGKR